MFPSLFVVILGLCYCNKESFQLSLGLPQLFGPSEALVKTVAEFRCDLQIYPENEPILLQLFKESDRNRALGDYTSLNGEVAVFPKVIKRDYEGNLLCTAKAQNNSNIQPTVSTMHYLKVVEPVSGAEIDVRSGQLEFFEGTKLEMQCKLAAGNHVSYKWLLNGRLVPQSHLSHDRLLITATSKDSGSYMCIAMNDFEKTQIYTSNSSAVVITVKDLVSNPDISFTMLKEDSFSYSAMVTCQSTKGTPPVTFSLHNKTGLVANMTTEERKATFKVPVVLGQHLGFLQCQANNGDQTTNSEWIPLEVVPVGGPVTMNSDYNTGENYAVIAFRFYCKAAKGSLLRYQWFLNKTLLNDRGSFYFVVDQPPEQSILVLSVVRSSAGTYHCEVSDSFDNSTVISSKKQYLDKKVLNRLPVLVVAVVFGCFIVLILLVSVCCCIGVVFRRRQHGESLSGMELKRMSPVYEGELDLSKYNEDADVVKAATGGEFDQASDISVDEWPQIVEEKKTLEDEPVEEP
ncbi:Fc receptor-like protein 5 [Symphorus nematophorus]